MNDARTNKDDVREAMNLTELRKWVNQLKIQSVNVPLAISGIVMETCLTLDNLLEDFMTDTEVRDDYFVIIKGGFAVSIASLKDILPQIDDLEIKQLATKVKDGVNGILTYLDKINCDLRKAV